MAGRPRTVSDETIFDAVTAAIGEGGPDALTVQNVADRVGLTSPAVRQRFGSKRALLVAYAEYQAEHAALPFSATAGDESGPLDRLVDGLVAAGSQLRDKQTLTNNLALLHLDLGDPDLGVHAANHSRAVLRAMEDLIGQAIDARHLRPDVNTNSLAQAINATYNGALVTWAIDGTGPLDSWLRDRIEYVIDPHTTELPDTDQRH